MTRDKKDYQLRYSYVVFLVFQCVPRLRTMWRLAATKSAEKKRANKLAAVAAAAICLVLKAYMRGGNS